MERREAAALLGITDDASEHQLRTAYRRRIRERHPDRAGPAATLDAARIIEAYRVLSDPDATTDPVGAPEPGPAPVVRTAPPPDQTGGLVTPAGSGPWSVVLSLQGRADRVEAFCTVEALDGSEAQSGPVVSLLLDSLRRRLRGR